MGLDISSSSTGWNIVDVDKDEKKLIEYGLICPVGSMGVIQRLYFFGNECKKLIDKFEPNEIAIEETVLVRGPKIMRTLARFSGVALFLAYSYQKREISTFEPSSWKKTIGLGGNAKKPEIQLKICEEFSLIDKTKYDNYQNVIENLKVLEKSLKKPSNFKGREIKIKHLEKKQKRLNSELKKKEKESNKKRGLSESEIKRRKQEFEELKKATDEKENELKQIKNDFKKTKKERKEKVKSVTKSFEKISVDIYSDSGINADIADSIGVSLAAIYETF